jgi:hypothetical protein
MSPGSPGYRFAESPNPSTRLLEWKLLVAKFKFISQSVKPESCVVKTYTTVPVVSEYHAEVAFRNSTFIDGIASFARSYLNPHHLQIYESNKEQPRSRNETRSSPSIEFADVSRVSALNQPYGRSGEVSRRTSDSTLGSSTL